MKKNLYNSKDEEYQHVISLLQNLPQVKASENFEYNLRVKIENNNFDLKTEKNHASIGWWKFTVPAMATTAAVILIFTFTSYNPDEMENPLQIDPQPRIQLSSGNIGSAESSPNKLKNSLVSENDVLLNRRTPSENNNRESVNKEVASSTLADVNSSKPDYPFDNSKITNLDEVLAQNQNRSILSGSASLAGRSNNNFFTGFFIREEVDKEYVDQLKAKNDSLMKVIKNRKKTIKNAE